MDAKDIEALTGRILSEISAREPAEELTNALWTAGVKAGIGAKVDRASVVGEVVDVSVRTEPV